MSERLKQSPEHEFNKERLNDEGAEQRERLREQLERSGERSKENNVEQARHEALEQAKTQEKPQTREVGHQRQGNERRRGFTKVDREESYEATMSEIRTHMSPASRAFSKVIHNKVVEQTSEAVGNTVARPNAILSGAVAAFILTLGVYLVAKNYGYPLSGFETIGAFTLGWALGIAFDFLKAMITGRSS